MLLVGGLGAFYLNQAITNGELSLSEGTNWSEVFNDYIEPMIGVAVATVFIAVIGGLLIEQFAPQLRAPERDPSRWLVVLVLGLTLGPIAFVLGSEIYEAFMDRDLPVFEPGQIIAVGVVAYLLAEVFMGRGSSRGRSGSN